VYRLKVQREEKEKDSRYIQESCVPYTLSSAPLIVSSCQVYSSIQNELIGSRIWTNGIPLQLILVPRDKPTNTPKVNTWLDEG